MTREEFNQIVIHHTITSTERINSLFDSLEHIRLNNVKGDIVECGIYKGGNIYGIIEYCHFFQMPNRVWGYDTFSGMTEPEEVDVDLNGSSAKEILNAVMCDCPLDQVKNLLDRSKFDRSNLFLVEGDVEITLDNESNLPKEISLLRLDTDWYRSTKKEMEVLYPRLTKGGILIVDDYGHWSGAKKAIDEYFNYSEPAFEKIDYTGIKLVKK